MTSRSPLAAVTLCAAVLLLVGCSAPTLDESAPTEPEVSNETGSDGESSDADAIDEPTVALPDSWPAEVPVIEGRIVDAFAVGGESMTFWGARIVPDAPLETAHDVGLEVMQSAGFELIGEADNDLGTRNRQYQTAEFTVFVNISTEAGEEGVLYNVQPR